MSPPVKLAKQTFAPGTSRKLRNVRTFSLQMEREIRLDKARAKRLKELRGVFKPGDRGYPSQEECAAGVGVPTRTYQNWERGLGINPSYRQDLAAFWTKQLDSTVTEQWIMYGDEHPESARSQIDQIQGSIQVLVGLTTEVLTELEGLAQHLGIAAPSRRKRPGVNGAAENASGE